MSAFSRFASGLRAVFDRRRADQDLADEVQHYIESAAAANRARGMSPDDAMRAARASIGSISSTMEPSRSFGWEVAMESFVQDVRYALRYLLKSPGFTFAAALSLALGIGANTAIFSMVNAMLIRRLPLERAEELYTIASPSPSGVYSYPQFRDLLRANNSFSGMTAFGGITVSLTDAETSDLVSGNIVTGNFFEVLGVRPLRGRVLTAADDQTPGAHPVAVISAGLWKSRFAQREDIVGHSIRLNGQAFTIIGVTPPAFRGIQPGSVRDVFVPMMMQAWMRPPRGGYSGEMNPDLLNARGNSWLFAVGRIKPGVTIEQATAAFNATVRAMGDWTPPGANPPQPVLTMRRLDAGPPGQREQLVSVARLLMAVVFVVLIIACANVANLLLSRATARRKEIAVRLAIGATRPRLVRQLLTESVMLATAGGVMGLALAWISVRAVRNSPPPAGALPVTLDFAIDLRVLAFTMGLSVLTGVVFGLAPAMRASRPELIPALKDLTTGAGQKHRRLNARNGLIVAQVALSFVLLIAAGLFVRSLQRTRAIEPGFDVDRVLTVPLNIQLLRYTRDQGKTFYRQAVERVEALPGVESASIVRWVPLSGGGSTGSLHIEGQGGNANDFQSEGSGFDLSDPAIVSSDLIGVNYFRTMGIAVTRGRDFGTSDAEGTPPVAIVNETFVKRHFGNANPIGRRISVRGPNGPWIEIVGVSADSRYATLDEAPTRMVYLPFAQNHVNGATLIVRAAGNPTALTSAVGREVHALDPSLPVAGARTLNELVGVSIYAARAGAMLLMGFGALALLLAAVGLYGVLAYAVSRRTREFGLRIALGANARNVLAQVLGEGITMVGVGVAAGLIVAFSVTRLLGRFLYGVSATDARTFIITPVMLLIVATVASLIPARRATKVDPIRALKED